ncbi:glutamyl-tRNA(Gln) amidotransferase subunit C, chloroplastic/mitochondrial [Dendrobium catenatum]|uniref:Glutamyl-tRNA(Gln) amidotransferase subunit C, chloroplastic/mitochondrial n=1 Tax=Dendrobium catenatum TaxID=906689 RepID=A0A2I0VLX9_9ASPA|nr:glutamyl-tRNA(Gln) amidotransferase subunit C, chloroplastic/mitochondrial [Dendrobium catenatum]PKU64416.1 Glutamyl-tRNA(Gln) amidotransferase subunit C, chloroplastic/mitochondrial [Dendrobium catenatum]
MVSVVARAGAAALRSFENRKPVLLRRRLFASAPRCSSLQPPDVPLLADAARISLSEKEVEDFAPKIRQVIDWFGQLQAVDLVSVQPSFRADTELNADLREDSPETFQNREAMLAEVPNYDSPYIKVPKVINKE